MKTIKRPRKLMRVRNAHRVNGLRNQQMVLPPVMILVVIKLGFEGMNPEGLLMRLRKHILMLTDNSNFPTTIPSLAELEAMADELEDTIDKVAAGDRRLMEHRNTLFKEGKEMIRLLSYNIQFISKGDKEKIASAGFDSKAGKGASRLPNRVMLLRAKAIGGGKIKLQWKRQTVVDAFFVEVTDDPINGKWELMKRSTRASIVLEGLNPGQLYYFRVFAVNSAGDGIPSAISEQRCL